MSKVRINDLARELEVKSRQILDVLAELGLAGGKTHSSSLEEHEAEKVRAQFEHGSRGAGQGGASSRGTQGIAPKIDLSHVSKPGDVMKAILARKQEEEAEARKVIVPAKPAPVAPTNAPAKPAAPVATAAPPAAAPARPEPRKIVPQARPAPSIIPPQAPRAIASKPPVGPVIAKAPATPARAAVAAVPPAGAVVVKPPVPPAAPKEVQQQHPAEAVPVTVKPQAAPPAPAAPAATIETAAAPAATSAHPTAHASTKACR